MSLLFNMLSRFVITFLPRSKHLLISWLQSPSAVILEPLKIKFLTVSILFPSPTPGACPNSCDRVGDAIQPSHPWSAPSPPTFNLSSIRVFSNESVLRIQWPKYWSFSFSKGLSRVFSNTTVQKHQFFHAQLSL